MSADRRKFRRYNVSELKIIQGQMDKFSEDKKLVTFGGGGCGFYAPTADSKYQPIKRVFLTFQLFSEDPNVAPQKFEIQGNVVYLKTIHINAKEVYFYGVEFLEAHRELIQPIVTKLEELEKQGKVLAA